MLAPAHLRRMLIPTLVRAREVRQARLRRALTRAAHAGDAVRAARILRRICLNVAAGPGRLDGRQVRRRLPRVAVLSRSQFTEDARMLAEALGASRVLLIPREGLKALAQANLPVGTGDLTYRTMMARDPRPMLKHRAFLRNVWDVLDPDRTTELVLTANAGYWAEIEFGAALEESGTAFVALHKENLKSVGHAARWEPLYRQERAPFLGRLLLVQNSGESRLQLEAGIVPPDRIAIVGMSRLDMFHQHRRLTAESRADGDIVIAGFLPGTNLPSPTVPPGKDVLLGLPLPDPERRPEHLVEACLALNRVAVSVARRLPNRRVILKTKGRDQDRLWAPLILNHVAGPEGLPENLVLMHGGDAVRLTQQAGVVAGLNSTMLLESIAAGRPTVALELGEAANTARDFVVDLAGAAEIVRDEESAVACLVRLVESSPMVAGELTPTEVAVLERWTGNPDGHATARTVEQLALAMRSRQSERTDPPVSP
jgi:hypothetical protein